MFNRALRLRSASGSRHSIFEKNRCEHINNLIEVAAENTFQEDAERSRSVRFVE